MLTMHARGILAVKSWTKLAVYCLYYRNGNRPKFHSVRGPSGEKRGEKNHLFRYFSCNKNMKSRKSCVMLHCVAYFLPGEGTSDMLSCPFQAKKWGGMSPCSPHPSTPSCKGRKQTIYWPLSSDKTDKIITHIFHSSLANTLYCISL